MKVSYDWLSSMVELPDDPAELVCEFIRTGTEVEAVETVGEAFDRVVTAQVLTKEKHPDSDHMWVCSVDVGRHNVNAAGEPEPLQIVCGAQNFEAGDHIVTALVGAELPGGVKIKKSKLRGVASCGMNCSQRELGLSGDHEGIWVLSADAPVGMPLAQYLGTSDTVLDCEITPNRPDCLSMIGMAREVGAIFDRDVQVELPSIQAEAGTPAKDSVSVELLDEGLCDRYVARVVRGVKVGPSPEWLVQRLSACGIRTHNNVVDITNYVMMLTGQPLHAFDLAAFEERDGRRNVVVRAAREGERFRTLDDVERTLSAGMGLIATGEAGATPVALAGVMGGMASEVTDDTVDVLVESACFNAGRTSHTSRDLALISDASIRFERQVDETGCADVAAIACALIEDLASGSVAPGCVDVYPAPHAVEPVELRLSRVHALCGAAIEPSFIERALGRLGCTLTASGTGEGLVYTVIPPTFRPDLPREIDLIEEVLRLWGMGRVEASIPAARNHIGGLTREQRLTRKVGQVLRACGLNETMNFSFAAPGDLERIGMTQEGRGCAVQLMNPLVAEQTEMRRSLLPGLLQSVEFNITHSTADVQLYEIGTLFIGRENASAPKEREAVAGVMSGAMGEVTWNRKPMPLRFFDGKGVVEELLDQLRIPKVRFRPADGEAYAFLQPGRGAEILSGGAVLGWVGEIHPDARDVYGIDIPVVAFELNLDALLHAAGTQEAYREFSQFPSVEHDLAIVVDEDVTCEDLERRLRSAGGKLLAGVRLFDVYRDPMRVGPHKKSMAFALTYRSEDHTLTSEEVERAHEKLVAKVCKATGGEVRS